VFVPRGLSAVPLAPPEVTGLLNLRGRIVAAIDLRRRLEKHGEPYGIIVDKVGDVLRPERATHEANPVNLDGAWASVCDGVHRLEDGLIIVLDVDKVLDLNCCCAAA
jgi:purine-binding chemotaxis protein CheW